MALWHLKDYQFHDLHSSREVNYMFIFFNESLQVRPFYFSCLFLIRYETEISLQIWLINQDILLGCV